VSLEAPAIAEMPDAPQTPEPEIPEIPEVPELPEEPEIPAAPEVPEEPEIPEMPESPEVPEEPTEPTEPTEPSEPSEPEFLAVQTRDGLESKASTNTESGEKHAAEDTPAASATERRMPTLAVMAHRRRRQRPGGTATNRGYSASRLRPRGTFSARCRSIHRRKGRIAGRCANERQATPAAAWPTCHSSGASSGANNIRGASNRSGGAGSCTGRQQGPATDEHHYPPSFHPV